MTLSNLLIFGCDPPPPDWLQLRAGPLTASFDPASLFLRRISLGAHEVIRAIYAAVRDQNWGTVPVRLLHLSKGIDPRSFKIEFEAECHQGPIRFRWQGTYSGAEDGTIACEFRGMAETTFLRNRIGFCVLHPITECAGSHAQIEHQDGTVESLRFPDLIEPQIFGKARFHDLKSITHEVQPGVRAKVTFEGETFETEDQRNWTDASYKTYCTPLSKPFPVQIAAGTEIRQKVTLKTDATVPSVITQPHANQFIVPEKPTAVLPQIGSSLPSADVKVSSQLTAFESLSLSHLRADLRLGEPGWRAVLKSAANVSDQLCLPLELALHCSASSELTSLASELRRHALRLKRISIFRKDEAATRPATLQLARDALQDFGVPFGGGTDAHFCELNREQALGHFQSTAADFISWPITPQVHAFDHYSIIENLEAQLHTVRSARQFSGQKPLIISPITLRPRFNAVATSAGDDTPVPESDPRQHSLFAAAWTLGTLAALTSADVQSVTLYEIYGPRGLAPTASFSNLDLPLISLMRSLPLGCDVYPCLLPNKAALLAIYKAGHLNRAVLANLQACRSEIVIRHLSPKPHSVKCLHANQVDTAVEARQGIIYLQAHPYQCYLLEF